MLATSMIVGVVPTSSLYVNAEDIDAVEEEVTQEAVEEEATQEVVEEEAERELKTQEATSVQTAPNGSTYPDLESGTYGSGSAMLNQNQNDYRFYTEFMTAPGRKANFASAGIERNNQIHVYLNEGETVYFGSSVADSEVGIERTKKRSSSDPQMDIAMILPKGMDMSQEPTAKKRANGDWVLAFDVKNETNNKEGYIANPKQETKGPKLNQADQNNDDKYIPLYYTAKASGVYSFDFYSKAGVNNGASPATRLTKDNREWNQCDSTVAAWDVTVVGAGSDGKAEVKSGRAWADYLAITTGGGMNYKSTLNVHVLTKDGFIYRVSLKEILPFGFIFFANNMGFTTTGSTHYSLQHSFYDNDNELNGINEEEYVTVHKPNSNDTATEETYKIFFNEPNPDLDGKIDNRGNVISTTPKSNQQITNLSFRGSADNISRYQQGGTFTFTATNATSATITMDFREALQKLRTNNNADDTLKNYIGTGVVELKGAVKEGTNIFPWDGKDTAGEYIPIGNYPINDIQLVTEAKGGEVHFPMIDVEGMRSGFTVERLNGDNDGKQYDICYNNSPMVYGSIEGKTSPGTKSGNFYQLSDGTRSYANSESSHFKKAVPLPDGTTKIPGERNISTLTIDDKEYVAKKRYNKTYVELDETQKAVVDFEFQDGHKKTYHHEPINSKDGVNMIYANDAGGYNGAGNMSGIDVWTYYTKGTQVQTQSSFAVIQSSSTGQIDGYVFYDNDKNGAYDQSEGSSSGGISHSGDYALKDIKVRLMDKHGNPMVHTELLPQFDENGYFLYDDNGEVLRKPTVVEFEATTDSSGRYIFTGVPFKTKDENGNTFTAGSDFYVQVMLNDVQRKVLSYASTTSNKAVAADMSGFLKSGVTAIPSTSGADGNKVNYVKNSQDQSTLYQATYLDEKDVELKASDDTVFDASNAQMVNLKGTGAQSENVTGHFKNIGYVTCVPQSNQRDYKVVKEWANGTHQLDKLIVELWVWNDNDVQEVHHSHGLNRRTGALIDKQVLTKNADEKYEYTWEHLDNRLQYYVIEYYEKKKEDGTPIKNDKGETKQVLIGGTFPIYDLDSGVTTPMIGDQRVYGFAKVDDYKETVEINGEKHILVQYFRDGIDGIWHSDATTEEERSTTADANARSYDMTYRLTKETIEGRKTNVITLKNAQTYDEREYYVWLGHETELPNFITKSHLKTTGEGNEATTELVHNPVKMRACSEPNHNHGNNTDHIIGLTISSLDAAGAVNPDNAEGNSTDKFHLKKDAGTETGTSVTFTATKDIYKTGTGSRTYKCEYVTYSDTYSDQNKRGEAVSTKVFERTLADNKKERVLVDLSREVNNAGTTEEQRYARIYDAQYAQDYNVYTWTLTIHVYDVKADGVIEYDPSDPEPIKLQTGLASGHLLNWRLSQNSDDIDDISYLNDDDRHYKKPRNPNGHEVEKYDPILPNENRAAGEIKQEVTANTLLGNDTYRVPLYKHAIGDMTSQTVLMGSCADIVGIAYSPGGIVSDATAKNLTYWDTNQGTNNTANVTPNKSEQYNYAYSNNTTLTVSTGTPTFTGSGSNGKIAPGDGYAYRRSEVIHASTDPSLANQRGNTDRLHVLDSKAAVSGKGGMVDVQTNTQRMTEIDRGQDHLNYVDVTFTANHETITDANKQDVFYYKVVIFGEDSTYSFRSYEDIDASQGVVMYAPFVMEPITSDAKIAGATLSIGNTTDLNFYVSGLVGNDENSSDYCGKYYMEFVDESGQSLLNATDYAAADLVEKEEGIYLQKYNPQKNLKLEQGGVTYYGFTYQNLNAYEMDEDITAILYYRSGEGKPFVQCGSKKYSVKQYAKNMLGQRPTDSTTDPNAKLNAMLVDMVNYGYHAEEYAYSQGWISKVRTGSVDRVNDFLSGDEKAKVASVPANNLDGYKVTKPTGTHANKFNHIGVGLIMDTGMSMDLKVEFKISDDLKSLPLYIRSELDDNLTFVHRKSSKNELDEDVTLTKDENKQIKLTPETWTKEQPSTRFSIEVDKIPPFFWYYPYQVYFDSDAANDNQLKYSVLTYCYDKLNENGTDEKFNNLLKAMYNYGETSKVWYEDANKNTYGKTQAQ